MKQLLQIIQIIMSRNRNLQLLLGLQTLSETRVSKSTLVCKLRIMLTVERELENYHSFCMYNLNLVLAWCLVTRPLETNVLDIPLFSVPVSFQSPYTYSSALLGNYFLPWLLRVPSFSSILSCF